MIEMRQKVKENIEEICRRRDIHYDIAELPFTPVGVMSKEVIDDLEEIAQEDNIPYKLMHSGVGHDAMIFSTIVDTNLIFIPCYLGISHNPGEKEDLDDASLAGKVLLEYLERKNHVN